MDTFENTPYDWEQEAQPAQSENDNAYRGTGAGRKESPYADAPYQMPHQAQPEPQSEPQPQPQPQQPHYQRTYYYEPEQPVAPKAPKAPKARKKKGTGKRILAAVLALVLLGGSCAATAGIVNAKWEKRASRMEEEFDTKISAIQNQLQTQIDSVSAKADQQITIGSLSSGEGLTPAQIYAKNVNAVVMVQAQVVYTEYGRQSTGTSTGSGFLISEDGYILTNCHVIEDSSAVSITTYAGQTYEAQIIGSDSTNDVALLKIDGEDLPCTELGSSSDLIVGDQVVAIGNPLGELTSTMTVGYVSGKERSVTTDGTTINMIQTDAAINSGNSGGPLFNSKGQVVGIITAKYSGSSSSGATIEGIGFAIPIEDVMNVADDLMEYGYVKSAYMGVSVQDMDSSVAEVYGLPVGTQVKSVEDDGPAAKAGMRTGDIIIGLGGETVSNYNDLARLLRNFEPGDTTTVTVFRSGQELELTITLTEKPQDTDTGTTDNSGSTDSSMPSEGSYDEWFNYFDYIFGRGNSGR